MLKRFLISLIPVLTNKYVNKNRYYNWWGGNKCHILQLISKLFFYLIGRLLDVSWTKDNEECSIKKSTCRGLHMLYLEMYRIENLHSWLFCECVEPRGMMERKCNSPTEIYQLHCITTTDATLKWGGLVEVLQECKYSLQIRKRNICLVLIIPLLIGIYNVNQ